MLRTLGADYVIDYRQIDFTKTGKTYDLVLDVKTNRSINRYLRALKPKGKYITVGGSGSRLLQAFLFKPLISVFSNKKIVIVMLKTNKDLLYMNKLFESGKLRTIIDGNYRLEDIPEAFRRFSRAEHLGKIVITVAD